MPYASLALLSTATTIDRTIWELKAPGSSAPAIIEMCFNSNTASGMQIGLGKPSVPCTGPTPNPFQMDDPSEIQTNVTAAISYSLTGGVPSFFVRRGVLGSLSGLTVIWTWPAGLRVPAATSMCIWAVTTPTPANIHCVIEE